MGGKIGLAGLLALVLVAACGEVTTDEDAGLCAQGACDDDDSDGGAPDGVGSGREKKPKGPGAADGGAGERPEPTEITMLPCQVCAQADACCKVEGRADCHYTKACTSAKPGRQQWHEARCRAFLAGRGDASEPSTGVCGS